MYFMMHKLSLKVEKYGLENTDFISDAVTLYIDFVAIFVKF